MPRKPMPWFRFYSETAGDPKLRRLTMTQRWIWVCILCAAGESPRRGWLLIADTVPMRDSELAEYAGVRPRDIRPAIQAMTKLGMVEVDGNVLHVTNWEQRQKQSDSSTSRVQAYRERTRNVPTDSDATLQASSNTRRRNVTETVVVTGPSRASARVGEEETEEDLTHYLGEGNVPARANARPPDHCLKHPGGTDQPCIPCKRARLTAEQWDTEAPARRRAATQARQAAITACTHCDEHGWQLAPDGGPRQDTAIRCTHPTTAPADSGTHHPRETA